MKNLAVIVILSGAVICGSGCATHYGNLPARQEFRKPLYELQFQYPELKRCEPSFGRYMCTPIWEMPYVDDLVAKWGEPDEKHISWWNLISLPPLHPMSRWYWHIENKTIDVLVDRPIIYGYEAHVFTLKIVENGRKVEPWVEPQAAQKTAGINQGNIKESPVEAAPVEADTFTRLKALKELKDAGLLTDEEYETRRKALVGQL